MLDLTLCKNPHLSQTLLQLMLELTAQYCGMEDKKKTLSKKTKQNKKTPADRHYRQRLH